MSNTPAFFVRIVREDGNGGLTCENSDGALFPVPGDLDIDQMEPGDVVRVSGDEWKVVGPENWVERTRIAVIRVVTPSGAAVDANNQMIDATNPRGLKLSEGNTIRMDARNAILNIVSLDPLRPEPLQIERSEDGFDIESLVESTQDLPLGWKNFGGFPDIVDEAKEIVETHLGRRRQFEELGVTPLRGVIFKGPPGTGKTFLGRIMAKRARAKFYLVNGADLGGHLVGESEGRLQELYDQAAQDKLAIIFIDELDSLTHQRNSNANDHADRLVSTFLVNMDGFKAKNNVLTIGTTNRVDDIDTALRRPGRFGLEIEFRHPDENDRIAILRAGEVGRPVKRRLSHETIARLTDGWSAADLDAVWTAAATLAVRVRRTVIADDHYVMGYEHVRKQRGEGRALR